MERKKIYYISGAVFILILCYFLFLSAPGDFVPGTIVHIESGEGLRAVSRELKEENVIRSRLLLEVFVILFGGERRVMVADYLFEDRISVISVASRLARGEHHMPAITVTIPEGFDVLQIA